MNVAHHKFRVSVGWHRGWLLILPVGLAWIVLWPAHLAGLYVIALLVIPLTLLAMVPGVEVGPDGIRLYRANVLRWTDIVDARPKKVLTLPYLKVRKTSGLFDWWVPLFLHRREEFWSAVREHAPAGNAFRSAVEEYFTQQVAAADAGTAGRSQRG